MEALFNAVCAGLKEFGWNMHGGGTLFRLYNRDGKDVKVFVQDNQVKVRYL